MYLDVFATISIRLGGAGNLLGFGNILPPPQRKTEGRSGLTLPTWVALDLSPRPTDRHSRRGPESLPRLSSVQPPLSDERVVLGSPTAAVIFVRVDAGNRIEQGIESLDLFQ